MLQRREPHKRVKVPQLLLQLWRELKRRVLPLLAFGLRRATGPRKVKIHQEKRPLPPFREFVRQLLELQEKRTGENAGLLAAPREPRLFAQQLQRPLGL